MIAALKVALPIELNDCVVIVVGDGGKSPPTTIDKPRFIRRVAENIRKVMLGFELAGLPHAGVLFTLPVELYILARHTIGSEHGAMSVLEVIAQHGGIRSDQIGPEYPSPDGAKIAFDQVNNLLLSARRENSLLVTERKRYAFTDYIAGKACELLAELSAEIDDTGGEAEAIMCGWDSSGSSAGEAAAKRVVAALKAGGK